ncbi:MAG: redoxin domain-containing protein [Bacteroidia bacterium]|nr:redoxin domain-containing protein [Bacteroidia bacterium]
MKTSYRSLLLLLFTLAALTGFAQKGGYKLDFKIEGLRDSTVLLGFYYGESTFAKDTARINARGEFTFDGPEALPRGVYFLAVNKEKAFELLIGSNQHFKMETSKDDYVGKMKVTGDLDNELFFDNMRFNLDRHKEAEPYVKIIQDSTVKEEDKKAAREAYGKVNDAVMKYQADVIAKHPNTMTAKIFKANQPITIPDPPKNRRHNRLHVPAKVVSRALLRQLRPGRRGFHPHAPADIFRESERVSRQAPCAIPDTANMAIDRMVAMAGSNKETRKYLVYLLLLKYQNPEIMGLDGVFVHLYDTYFANGEMNYWANEKMRKNLKDHADRLRRSLVGNVAPNLIMQDLSLKPRSMYDIKNKYTILFIFDPDCGHCRQETPKLVQFYNERKQKFNFEVYAVSIDTSLAKMRDFISEMKTTWITVNGPRTYVGPYSDLYDAQTTPSLYIIDEKRKIIAKKLPVEKLEEFFTNYEKFMHKKGS